MEILSVGSELFRVDVQMDGQTDRHDEASCFSQFCEHASK